MSDPSARQVEAARERASEVTVRGAGQGVAQVISAGKHTWRADEPVDKFGDDSGPAPIELLLSALGSCTAITVRLYARHKGWPLEDLKVRLTHRKVDAAELPHLSDKQGRIDAIEREIELVGPLDGEQRARLLEIANRCPIHRTLTGQIDIRTRLAGP